MEQAQRSGAGGIAGLSLLLREHGEAIEADLARQGISLAGLVTEAGGLPWRRLRTLIYNLPPGSALHRSMDLPIAWTDETHVLAHIADQLAVANWYETKDGQKGRNRPKPMRRPGTKQADDGSIRYGTKQADPAAARAFLASIGPDRSVEQQPDDDLSGGEGEQAPGDETEGR